MTVLNSSLLASNLPIFHIIYNAELHGFSYTSFVLPQIASCYIDNV